MITVAAMAVFSSVASAKPEGGKGKKGKGARSLPDFIVTAYDSDGDGALGETERKAFRADVEARRSEMKAQYDTDGDGELNKTEREAVKNKKHADALAKYDGDSSGSLDETERKAMVEDLKANDPLAALAFIRHHGKSGEAGRGKKKGGKKGLKGKKES